MAVNYNNVVKDTPLTNVIAIIDGGLGGSLEICDADANVLAVIALANPSFSEASQVITLLGAPLYGVASDTGIATLARIKNSAGTIIVHGLTIGTSEADDITLNKVSITRGAYVTINDGTITRGNHHPDKPLSWWASFINFTLRLRRIEHCS
jgi:hypothetical protein